MTLTLKQAKKLCKDAGVKLSVPPDMNFDGTGFTGRDGRSQSLPVGAVFLLQHGWSETNRITLTGKLLEEFETA